MDNSELLQRLLATFRLEAQERLEAMSLALLQLEQQQPGVQRAESIEGIFREAHSLKGAARAVNLTRIEAVCQALESVLAALKQGALGLSEGLIELLYFAVDTLSGMIEPAGEEATDAEVLLEQLKRATAGQRYRVPPRTNEQVVADQGNVSGEATETAEAVAAAQPGERAAGTSSATTSGENLVPTQLSPLGRRAAPATVRISLAKLENLTRQAENLLPVRLAAEQLAQEVRQTTRLVHTWRKRRAQVQPHLRQLQTQGDRRPDDQTGLEQLLGYLESEQDYLKELEEKLSDLVRNAERDQRQLSILVSGLQATARELHLMPSSSLLEMFPRLVRELAREQGKDVRLEINGGDTEVDRRVLEELKDPLTHLVRNAIDHGIEKPAARRQREKPEQGRIFIAIEQRDSNRIQVVVKDDGAGVDTGRLRSAAAALGVVEADRVEALNDQELIELSFLSGISTSQMITDLSGRGLGLPIVREKIELLGGRVEASSLPGRGTTFRMILPLTLATFHGLLVRLGDRRFVLPSSSIERALLFSDADVGTVENRDTIVVQGQTLSLVRLDATLGMVDPAYTRPEQRRQAVVLTGSTRIAFEVDEIVGGQEVLIKPLGRQLVRVPNLQGATVLGTGEVVPVLNVPDLLHSATLTPSQPLANGGGPSETRSSRSIMVVEDSITSRSLLKGILESAGYKVRTAVDGIDAFTSLKTEAADLIVSDVDMPRLNGLELTARVRGDTELSELPVILVTSLSSPADRERGVEVGANAYIVKSSFDQSNLLDAVQRLIG
ncbi:MAG: hybrid sensor histidine kinase/response regulator [Trueperaceae bacterium]